MAKACNRASSGLAFTAIALFLMLLWASVQAVPASFENPVLSKHQIVINNIKNSNNNNNLTSINNSSDYLEWDCSKEVNKKLCKYFEDKVIHKRMKHRSNIRVHSNDNNNNINNKIRHINEPTIKSLKDLHERQVRSFEHNNKITKNKVPHDKNTFVKYENTETHYEIIRNISLDDKVNQTMNNGESSVSMESISETTLATFKESNVKTSAQKEASDKIYLHVNGE